jgi:helix-turn-helix protein
METASQPETKKLTVAEAAKYFGRCEFTIRRWCRDGTLLAFNYAVIRERPGCWTILIPQ